MPIGRHLTRGPDHARHLAGPLLGLCWLAGLYFKDRHPVLIWFYFIPALAMFLYGALWLVLTRRTNWRRARIFVIAATLLALAKMAFEDFAWHSAPDPDPDAIRVVHWNTARRFRKAPDVFQKLAGDRPDICLLSESPRVTNLYELGRAHLGLNYALDDQGMTIFSRYPITPVGDLRITMGHAWVVRVETPLGPLDVMAFDLVSNPIINRAGPMQELADWVGQRGPDVPLVLLGDFNTPRDSLSFEPLRRHLRNAYEIAGNGWPYSWPIPFPVYAIDHAWVSPAVRVLDHTYRASPLSDHLRQVLDIRL